MIAMMRKMVGWAMVMMSISGCTNSRIVAGGGNAPLNVVVITVSSLRADHVGCLGYRRPTTPEFDKFAAESTLFTNAYATSGWTMPSHASLFTSLYPKDHRVTHINHSLDEKFVTMAELLRGRGLQCAGFCCGPRVDSAHGFAQGFHLYDDFSVSVMLSAVNGGTSTVDVNRSRTNDLVNEAAMKWLGRNADSPFFLFVHYYDPHWDYLPPPPYDQLFDPNYQGKINGLDVSREPLFSNLPSDRDIDHLVALYDGEVRQTDKDLGELLSFLRDKQLMERSIVIILGDHGEQFYEHGHTSHHGVYDELIHIPMLMHMPGGQATAKRVDALVSEVDVLPTILDCQGMEKPKACRGVSLKPVLEGKADRVHDFIWAEYTGGAVGDSWTMRTTQLKCYKDKGRKPVIFDLTNDPREQYEISEKHFTKEMTDLCRILQSWAP